MSIQIGKYRVEQRGEEWLVLREVTSRRGQVYYTQIGRFLNKDEALGAALAAATPENQVS